jgi:hypothetical protein
MDPLFLLNNVHNEFRNYRSLNDDKGVWILDGLFSNGEGGLDDKLGYPFEENSFLVPRGK